MFDYSGSLFTNSSWFASFEDERIANEQSIASSSPNIAEVDDEVMLDEDDDLADTAISNTSEPECNVMSSDKPPEWVEWRESCDSPSPTSNSVDTSNDTESNRNGEASKAEDDDIGADKPESCCVDKPGAGEETIGPSQSTEMDEGVREVEDKN